MDVLNFIDSMSGVLTLPKRDGKTSSGSGQRGRQMSPEKVAFFKKLQETGQFTWDNLNKSKSGQLAVTLGLDEIPGLPDQDENESDFDYYSRINVYIANLITGFIHKTFDEAYHDLISPIKPIKNALAFNSKVESVVDGEGFPVMSGNCQVFKRVPTDFIPQNSTENLADYVNRLNTKYGRQRTMSDCSEETGWVTQPNRIVFWAADRDYRVIFGIRRAD